MAKFKKYTRYAASFCPDLPSIVFSRAMLSSAKEYFTKTQAWVETVDIAVTADKATYEMPFPLESASIDVVTEVKDGSTQLIPSPHLLDIDGTGTPKLFALTGKKSITLYPTPKTDMTLSVTYTLKPAFDTDELPEDVFEEHFEGLIAGAIWQIKRMVGTPWHDPQSAMTFYQEFEGFIDQKRIAMMMGGNNAELTMQIPKFN